MSYTQTMFKVITERISKVEGENYYGEKSY